MALFGSKKKTETVDAPVKAVNAAAGKPKAVKAPKIEKAVAVPAVPVVVGSYASAILRPRVTEKSGLLSQGGVYTFEVVGDANRNAIASAVKALYKVIPTKIAIINSPAKKVFVRGRRGTVSGIRKALVTLKKGDTIDFV